MPIIGLTDQQEALPIIGELRKGAKKPAKGPGKDLDYFRFTSSVPGVLHDFYNSYPEQPRQINAFLPHQTTEENFDAWIEKWVAGGLVYRSDGENVVLWRDANGKYSTEIKPDPNPGEGEDGKRLDGSMQVGRLSVIIPELGRFATVTVLTTSKNDILNLSRQLRMYEAMNAGLYGGLLGVPFVIRRVPSMISTPGKNGKRSRRQSWLLSVETSVEYTKAKMLEMQLDAMPKLPEGNAGLLNEPVEAAYTVIDKLPPGVSTPFNDDGTPETTESTPLQPERPWSPGDLKDKIQSFIDYCKANRSEMAKTGSNYHDPETGQAFPIDMHPFGPKTANFLSAKWQDSLKGLVDDVEVVYHDTLYKLFAVESANDLKAVEAAAMFRVLFNGSSSELKWDMQPLDVAGQELLAVYAMDTPAQQPDLGFDAPAELVSQNQGAYKVMED